MRILQSRRIVYSLVLAVAYLALTYVLKASHVTGGLETAFFALSMGVILGRKPSRSCR